MILGTIIIIIIIIIIIQKYLKMTLRDCGGPFL